jgi:hypothetical protein
VRIAQLWPADLPLLGLKGACQTSRSGGEAAKLGGCLFAHFPLVRWTKVGGMVKRRNWVELLEYGEHLVDGTISPGGIKEWENKSRIAKWLPPLLINIM